MGRGPSLASSLHFTPRGRDPMGHPSPGSQGRPDVGAAGLAIPTHMLWVRSAYVSMAILQPLQRGFTGCCADRPRLTSRHRSARSGVCPWNLLGVSDPACPGPRVRAPQWEPGRSIRNTANGFAGRPPSGPRHPWFPSGVSGPAQPRARRWSPAGPVRARRRPLRVVGGVRYRRVDADVFVRGLPAPPEVLLLAGVVVP